MAFVASGKVNSMEWNIPLRIWNGFHGPFAADATGGCLDICCWNSSSRRRPVQEFAQWKVVHPGTNITQSKNQLPLTPYRERAWEQLAKA